MSSVCDIPSLLLKTKIEKMKAIKIREEKQTMTKRNREAKKERSTREGGEGDQ